MGIVIYAICLDTLNQKSMESRMLEEIGWTEPRGFLGPLAFEWSKIFEAVTGCQLHTWYEYCDASRLKHASDKYGVQLASPYFQVVRWLEIRCEHSARIQFLTD
jgi:hypothetical protein